MRTTVDDVASLLHIAGVPGFTYDPDVHPPIATVHTGNLGARDFHWASCWPCWWWSEDDGRPSAPTTELAQEWADEHNLIHHPQGDTVTDTATDTRLIDTDPIIQFRPSHREITLTWEVTTTDDGTKHLAIVHIFHHGDRTKAFVASLNRHALKNGALCCMPFSAVTVARKPVARYSAKEQQYFVPVVLATLREQRDDQRVREVFGELEDRDAAHLR